MVVVGDEELLTGCAVLSAFLQSKGSPTDTEPRTELDAVVGIGDFDSGSASRVDKLLSRRVVTTGTVRRIRAECQQSFSKAGNEISHADGLVVAGLAIRHSPAQGSVVGRGPENRLGAD